MTEEANAQLKNTIEQIEKLENEQAKITQKEILDELYELRESFSKCKPVGESTLNELYELRESMKADIERYLKLKDLLVRRDERIGHLKKNFKRTFDENIKLKAKNAELREELKALKEGGDAAGEK